MASDPMALSATVFIGPDMEGPPTTRRDTRHFDRLDEAIRYAIEQVPSVRAYGTYIRVDDGHGRRIEWDEIKDLYDELSGSN